MPSRALHLIRPLVHTPVSTPPLPVALQSISLFLLLPCSGSTHPPRPSPLCPLSLASSFTFLGGRLEAASGTGGGSAAGWPLEDSGQKSPSPWLLAPLPPDCPRVWSPAFVPLPLSRAGQSTTSLAPLSRLEARVTGPAGQLGGSCAGPGPVGRSEGESSRWCVGSWQPACAVPLWSVRELQRQVSGVRFSVPRPPSFPRLGFLHRSCFSLD